MHIKLFIKALDIVEIGALTEDGFRIGFSVFNRFRMETVFFCHCTPELFFYKDKLNQLVQIVSASNTEI